MPEAVGQDAPTATFIPPHQLAFLTSDQHVYGPPCVRPKTLAAGMMPARGLPEGEGCGADQMKAQHVLTHFKAEGSHLSS